MRGLRTPHALSGKRMEADAAPRPGARGGEHAHDQGVWWLRARAVAARAPGRMATICWRVGATSFLGRPKTSGLPAAECLVLAQAAGAGADAQGAPKPGPAQRVAPGSFLDLLLRTVDRTSSRGLTNHEIANQAPRPFLHLILADGPPRNVERPGRCLSLAQDAGNVKEGADPGVCS